MDTTRSLRRTIKNQIAMSEQKHTPDLEEKYRERVLKEARDYTDRQGVAYPVLPAYIAMIKSQIREAYYCGFELFEKDNAELLQQVADLLAKVSEQEKEIEKMKKVVEEREQTVKDFNMQWGVTANQLAAERVKVSEQSQRITDLMKENEVLRATINKLMADIENEFRKDDFHQKLP